MINLIVNTLLGEAEPMARIQYISGNNTLWWYTGTGSRWTQEKEEGKLYPAAQANQIAAELEANTPGYQNRVGAVIETKIDPKELAKGTKDEEKEHDMGPRKAKKTALQHLRRVDPHYYTKTEKCLKSESEERCQCYHGFGSPRKDELANLGWELVGDTWLNPGNVYYITDNVVDDLPEDEWQKVLAKTSISERPATPPKADIMPGGSLGQVGDMTGIGIGGSGGM